MNKFDFVSPIYEMFRKNTYNLAPPPPAIDPDTKPTDDTTWTKYIVPARHHKQPKQDKEKIEEAYFCTTR